MLLVSQLMTTNFRKLNFCFVGNLYLTKIMASLGKFYLIWGNFLSYYVNFFQFCLHFTYFHAWLCLHFGQDSLFKNQNTFLPKYVCTKLHIAQICNVRIVLYAMSRFRWIETCIPSDRLGPITYMLIWFWMVLFNCFTHTFIYRRRYHDTV